MAQPRAPGSALALLDPPSQGVPRPSFREGREFVMSIHWNTRLSSVGGWPSLRFALFKRRSFELVSPLASKYASDVLASENWLRIPSRRILSRLARIMKLCASNRTSLDVPAPFMPSRNLLERKSQVYGSPWATKFRTLCSVSTILPTDRPGSCSNSLRSSGA